MNILITAPSLNPSQNVSGVSSMVNNIIRNNLNHSYFHYLLGRPDQIRNNFTWIFQLVRQLVWFPIFLKRNKIELVHQNLPFDPKGILREYAINILCRMLGVPVVLHLHGGIFITEGTKNFFFKNLAHSLFKYSKQVIVLSELEQELLSTKFKFQTSKIISNSIDISTFDSQQPKILHQLPYLLYLGRIEKNKGIVELIESLKLLKKEFNFRFILCGTGPLLEYCKIECEKILGHDFEYRGVVAGNAKINVIKQASLFLLPSYFEGLPMALLETMSYGVVPIVTNVGSMQYIINHGVNGLLVEKKNIKDLYEKLKIILIDPKLYKFLSQNAIKTIIEKYNMTDYIIRLNQVYNSAITS